MKTVLYFKTNIYNSGIKLSSHAVMIQELARSYDNSVPESLYQITSEIYDADQIEQRYEPYNLIFLDEDEARTYGKQLQPDREIIDDMTGQPIQFSFELPEYDFIKLAKLKMTDVKVPRGVEDLFNALKNKGVLVDADAQTLADNIADKQQKRQNI